MSTQDASPTVWWSTKAPEHCNLCKAPLSATFVDGQAYTPRLCWCILCVKCHKAHGRGFGPSLGQLYQQLPTLNKAHPDRYWRVKG